MAGLKAWIDKNFLIVGLISALTIGLIFPTPGEEILKHTDAAYEGPMKVPTGPFTLRQYAVIIIFFISGVTLQKITQWKETIKALIIGSIFVLFITPLLGLPIIKIDSMTDVNPLLLQGMALFCAVPTTLSSGVAMVKSANGNVPLALILTTVTNLLGVFTMPWSMTVIFKGAHVQVDATKMLTTLVEQTLLPLVIGMAMQNVGFVKKFVTAQKATLGKTSNCCIFFVVWLSTSGSQSKIVHFPVKDLLITLALAILVHIVYRTSAYLMAQAGGFPGPEWVALVLMCSQKSLPVCVSVLEALPDELKAKSGTMIVPCIMSHFSQLMIDGYLADRWKLNEQGRFQYFEKCGALLSD